MAAAVSMAAVVTSMVAVMASAVAGAASMAADIAKSQVRATFIFKTEIFCSSFVLTMLMQRWTRFSLLTKGATRWGVRPAVLPDISTSLFRLRVAPAEYQSTMAPGDLQGPSCFWIRSSTSLLQPS